MYCDFLQIKENTKKDRNTKRTMIYNSDNTYIELNSNQITNLSKNKYLIEKTILDEKLNFRDKCRSMDFCIDKKKYWDTCLDLLEKNNISKVFSKNKYSHFNDSFSVKYTLPVISEYIITDKRTIKKFNDTFMYNDQKINKNHLYYSTDGKNFSLYIENFQKEKYEKFQKVNIKIFGNDFHGCKINTLSEDKSICFLSEEKIQIIENNGIEKWEGKIDHVDFDFGEDKKITHIFTKGRRHRIYNLQTKHGNVNFVTEKEKHFVDKYSLFYRVNSSKYWVSLGEFSGNLDRNNIMSHKFPDEINCRYIRLIPLSFSNSPSIQVGFFNPKVVKNQNEQKNIVYSLNLKSKKNYYTKSRNYWAVNEQGYHNKKRVEFRTEMKKYQQDFIQEEEN